MVQIDQWRVESLTLNLSPKGGAEAPIVYIRQGDKNGIRIQATLLDDGNIINSAWFFDKTVTLEGYGNAGEFSVPAYSSDGKLIAILPAASTFKVGLIPEVFFRITDKNGTVVASTANFRIYVKPGVMTNAASKYYIAEVENVMNQFYDWFQRLSKTLPDSQVASIADQLSDLEAAKTDLSVFNEKIAELMNGKADANYVKEMLTALSGGNPAGAYGSLDELKTAVPNGGPGVYVVGGEWFYWKNGNWVKGGDYQSSGIAQNSVSPEMTTFARSTTYLIDESSRENYKVYIKSRNTIGSYDSQDWKRYPLIPIKSGQTFYLHGFYGIFSFQVGMDRKTIVKEINSSKNELWSGDFTAEQDGFLALSTQITTNPAVFNQPKSKLGDYLADPTGHRYGVLNTVIPSLKIDGSQVTGTVDLHNVDGIYSSGNMLDKATKYPGKFWAGSPTPGSSADWDCFSAIKLEKGVTYSFKNIRQFFTYISKTDNTGLEKLSGSSNINYSAAESGELKYNEEKLLWVTTNKKYDGTPIVAQLTLDLLNNYGSQENKVFIPNLIVADTSDVIEVGPGKEFEKVLDAVAKAGNIATPARPITVRISAGTYDLYKELGGKKFVDIADKTADERQGMILPDYVNLEGVGKVVLQILIPDNEITNNASRRISPLNVWKHNRIKGIEFRAKNTRYVAHFETNNQFDNSDVIITDCRFIHEGNKQGVWQSVQAVAGGSGSKGRWEFVRCYFQSATTPFSFHTNHNQKANLFILTDCEFRGENKNNWEDYAVRFGTYGTGSEDSTVYMNNCILDKPVYNMDEQSNKGHGNHILITGSGNTMLPHKHRNTNGEALPIQFGDEVVQAYNKTSSAIAKGSVIKLASDSSAVVANNNFEAYAVMLLGADPGTHAPAKYRGFVQNDVTGIEKFPEGTMIKVENGRLVKTTNQSEAWAYQVTPTHFKIL